MTDVIIIHSKYGNATNHWYEWLKHNLTLEGYHVTLFNLEADDHAKIDEWVRQMKEQIEIRKYDTYFVTHGFGTIAALKYIEGTHHHIEGLFSIAGFKEDAHDIYENVNLEGISIDYEKVKSQVDHFYGLTSKDDKYVSYKETKRLMDTLEGKIRIVDEGGHFLEDEGFKTFTSLQSRMQGYMTK
ncbi:RBBP9/YdeN family alpha/beta hydrolase [Staphylococcus capitis]|uniref:RBBP9/YdeN family alpha/beta hydrolase n=1 Tax=Staphylococcus capitis TaxID=29388 RepID=UPI000D1AAA32|nr:alpha/beta hydrolase [Staphylococcus capitis]PTG29675.1 serine hydrolase family protein [Staphylococcus capitis]PTH19159.1 serine hydrolase family protein [Staphylococcus capitis]RIM33593.1 serine hydrolase family protein [Staphylococcus capitis]RIM50245.1 serine hydrolase family protein [Staphylococcus capitis]RIM54299.1 serine hydrolase family protein [Staphylococcus capitis]